MTLSLWNFCPQLLYLMMHDADDALKSNSINLQSFYTIQEDRDDGEKME